MSGELPKGWATTPLNQIAEINPRHPRGLDDSLPISFARMTALSESKPEFESLEERTLAEVRKGFTHFAEGDVLFAKITPCMENGKGAVARGLRNKLGCGTTELHVIRPLGQISPEYIYRFLAQNRLRRAAKENFTGTAGQARVPTSFIEELELPLAPLLEQRRIVAKLTELLGKVDASQQRLAKIPVLLKRFRQSVLAAACSGRLTADWREENSDTESAVQLLRSFNAKPLPVGDEDVPETWCWGKFGELVTNHDGKRIPVKQSDRDKRSGPYPYYGAFGVIDDIDEYLYDGDYLLLAEDGKNLESRLRPISLIASGKFWVNNHAHVLQTKGGIPLPFLNAWLNSPTLDLSPLLTGIDQVKLNRAAMDRIPVPIAPLHEQQEIVRRVAGLFALADQLEERLAKARGQVDALTPSLLARAFAGQLVPQDPTDEPAVKLLERIRNPVKGKR